METFDDFSILELFRMEVETQAAVLTSQLIALERAVDPKTPLENLMRAAHSLKGAGRIVGRGCAVQVAHAMEECFVAAQNSLQPLPPRLVDTLLEGVDLISRIAQVPDEAIQDWESGHQPEIVAFLAGIASPGKELSERPVVALPPPAPVPPAAKEPAPVQPAAPRDRALRVTTDNLDRLMALAGEAMVTTRQVDGYATELLQLKKAQKDLSLSIEKFRSLASAAPLDEQTAARLVELREASDRCQSSLSTWVSEFERFDRRFVHFSNRLYEQVLDCRMRPFSEGIQGFPRMVRDVARLLGKSVNLQVIGESTPVDRDILERLHPPLDHLLRNAIDHGIEDPATRQTAGKPAEGVIQLQASHSAGMLIITITDDGRGIDIASVRNTVLQRKLTTEEAVRNMSTSELLEFLFLPGFTLKESVSEISGRGVGLDVVQTMIREVGGRVRISSQPGRETRFQLELPLTLSVVRTLLVEIGGQPYAFPLARLDKAIRLPRTEIRTLEGRQYFTRDDQAIGLVSAHQVLDLGPAAAPAEEVAVIVLGEKGNRCGLAVDRFLGEQELVVRSLDPRLGKVRDISAAALMPDGSPVLIVDVDDITRSIELLASNRQLSSIGADGAPEAAKRRRRVLVVDDSLTVRELERKLLGSRGYQVDVAIDGMDGWNAVAAGQYDLVLTDIDMPRLDGIELLKRIRKDNRLKAIPVMIVSYKDRQEDRTRGLEAGADYYLTKASFHDETLLRVVTDLIGGPQG